MRDEEMKEIAEAYDRLDAVCAQLVMKFGAAATAKLLVILAKRYADVMLAEINRLHLEEPPRGHA